MEQKYTMADLLAEYGDRFDIYEEIGKENDRLFNPELVEEKTNKPIEEKINNESETEKTADKKDNSPKDITIKCKKCGNDFVWTISDQNFYKEKGFFKPSYCKECRKKMKVINNFHKIQD